jgi:hypothetical protein
VCSRLVTGVASAEDTIAFDPRLLLTSTVVGQHSLCAELSPIDKQQVAGSSPARGTDRNLALWVTLAVLAELSGSG